MSKVKEILGKAKSLIEWIFGIGFLITAIFYGISNFTTSFENDRLKLAKDIVRKVILVAMEEDGIKTSKDMIDVTMATIKNNNKAECGNSVIYYAFSVASDTIWIKTEKSGSKIYAEIMTE